MKKLIFSVIGLAVAILLHKSIFTAAINMRLSFTWSMIIPYIFEFFFIVSVTFQLYTRLLAEKPILIRRLFGLGALLGGCAIAFAFNPIYDGDFNHEYREVILKGNNESVFQKGITMVTMPGCMYCYMRTEELSRMKKIYPELPIRILVINEDTLSVQDYQKEAGEGIEVDFFPNTLIQTLKITGFPAIYYKSADENKPMINWDNRGFGSAAWDYVLKEERL